MPEPPEFVTLSVEEMQELFPQYQIVAFIAAGGMGAVYMAKQRSIDRTVAIKILPREMSLDADFSEQFKAEAKVMSRLNHPNLIGFFDLGSVDGMLFIVMEFVDGKSLHHSAHGVAISQDVTLDIVMGISQGLEHAHQKGLLHRDIKPANILLDQGAFPKIGDFGLARPVEESEAGKVIFGTPGYTAPEVVEDPERIDERSDIYSVGAILYELLTGHLPEDRYRPPSRTAGVDPAFDRVVQRAIAFDPENRYKSITDLLTDLKTIQDYHKQGQSAPKESLVAPRDKKIEEPSPSEGPQLKMPLRPGETKGTKGAVKGGSRRPVVTPSVSPTPKKGNGVKYVTIAALLLFLGIVVSLISSRRSEAQMAEEKATQAEVVETPPAVPSAQQEASPPVETPEMVLKTLERNRVQIRDRALKFMPKSTVVEGDRAYLLYPMEHTWNEAYALANNYGGSLVSLASEQEKDLVASLVKGAPKVWVGAGFSGHPRGYSWLDGSEWTPPNRPRGENGYLAMDNLGAMSFHSSEERKPFILSWYLKDANEGSALRHLTRLIESFPSKNYVLPPGAVERGNSLYYLSKTKATWNKARKKCSNAKTTLAVPNSKGELRFLNEFIKQSHGVENLSVWMGGTVQNGLLKWNAGENVPYNAWLTEISKQTGRDGVVLQTGASVGLTTLPAQSEHYYLYEWKLNAKEEEQAPSPEKPQKTKQKRVYEELYNKAKLAHETRDQKALALDKKLVADSRWAANQWLRALTNDQQEIVNAQLANYFKQTEEKGQVQPLPSGLEIPDGLKVVLERYVAKQQENEADLKAMTLKLKNAMTKKLQEEIPKLKKAGMINEASLVEKKMSDIRGMDERQFSRYLTQK